MENIIYFMFSVTFHHMSFDKNKSEIKKKMFSALFSQIFVDFCLLDPDPQLRITHAVPDQDISRNAGL